MRTSQGDRTGRHVGFCLGMVVGSAALFPLVGRVEEKKEGVSKSQEDDLQRKADKEVEESAKKQMDEFNKVVQRTTDPNHCAQAIRTLSIKHPLVINRLIQILDAPSTEAMYMASVDTLVKINDVRCVPALGASLYNRLGRKRARTVAVALAKAIGHFGDTRAAPAIAAALGCEEQDVIQAACDVSPKIKHASVVEALIALLKKAERPDIQMPARGGGRWGNNNQGTTIVNPFKGLREPAQKALQGVTGQKLASYRDWQRWWLIHQATWRG